MSLVTEDGTGLANAESYISVADALAYHAARGNDTWATITTTQQEQALRRATGYMVGEYRTRWKGRRVLLTQALDWPRVGVVLNDFGNVQFKAYGLFQISFTIVPTEVKNACAELALRAAAADLLADQERKVSQETVGPITVKYVEDSQQRVRYLQIDAMLRVYLSDGGNTASVKLNRC